MLSGTHELETAWCIWGTVTSYWHIEFIWLLFLKTVELCLRIVILARQGAVMLNRVSADISIFLVCFLIAWHDDRFICLLLQVKCVLNIQYMLCISRVTNAIWDVYSLYFLCFRRISGLKMTWHQGMFLIPHYRGDTLILVADLDSRLISVDIPHRHERCSCWRKREGV